MDQVGTSNKASTDVQRKYMKVSGGVFALFGKSERRKFQYTCCLAAKKRPNLVLCGKFGATATKQLA